MLTIWGRLSSINVQKVVWAAGEVGQPFERIDLGGSFGGVREPTFLAKNPNGLVPVLEDGGVCLFESNSIVRYLAARYGAGWIWQEDPARRAEADLWLDWTLSSLQPALAPVLWGVVRKLPGYTDPAKIAAALAASEAMVEILEAHLATRSFLADERFGMADIVVGTGVHRWLNMPVERTARPHVERWYGTVAARPAAKVALPLPVT